MVEYFNPEHAAHELVDLTTRSNAMAEALMLARNKAGQIVTRVSIPEGCTQALSGVGSLKLDAIRALQGFGVSDKAIDELEDAAANLAAKSRRRERYRVAVMLEASSSRPSRDRGRAIEIAEQRLVRAFAAVAKVSAA